MKEVQVFYVDAFTDRPFGGNAAGVVPNADGLTDEEMQHIAREINLSETAFIFNNSSEQADFRIRYFTPSSEIDFCGHATVGLSWILATEFDWSNKAKQVLLETNIGLVPVKWLKKEEGKLSSVVMTQVAPKVKEFTDHLEDISRMVGVDVADIDSKYPIKLGYTGNWHLLIPVKSRPAIDAAIPKIDDLKEHNQKAGISTTHLFTFDSQDDTCKVYTRDFAPAVGIAEDPVTGSANGALAGYFALEEILVDEHYKIAQGHTMGRPGFLDIFVEKGEEGPVVSVGGKAVRTLSGKMRF
ncbi:PhzF family phenazine biosynthesis protein [Cytobacillus sp. FJAT-54145]|uniref:PhzF family phenazine biosynthesis protein n=1 Tax=Cytobacillus spartinae TaxID=3299023 RepID=A0ABW6K6Q1_9BACI